MPETSAATENVDLVRLDSRLIYLIGTAHISKASAELVDQTIRKVRPQTVAVELCQARYQSLKNPERWKNMDIYSVIRAGKAYVLMAQLMLAAFQKKLGDKLGIKPGAEMMAALKTAEELGAQTLLADRDITVTLKRTWAGLSLWSMGKVLVLMLSGLFSKKTFDEAEIERLKRSDALDELMKEFSEKLPEVRTTLIDERDRYLAARIQSAPGPAVVAVVGAGHVQGIKKWLGKEIDTAALEVIPPPNVWLRLAAWFIPVAALGLIVYGFFASGMGTSAGMISSWVWITGCAAALGAAIALAHPLTIICAFITAPFTTLHPLLASGWIAGLVEAWIRKPRVSDLETIADDVTQFSGLWKNRVSKILLIMALTNLFGALGALYGLKVVASLLQ